MRDLRGDHVEACAFGRFTGLSAPSTRGLHLAVRAGRLHYPAHFKAHRSAGGAKKGGYAQAIGISRGGHTRTLHALTADHPL